MFRRAVRAAREEQGEIFASCLKGDAAAFEIEKAIVFGILANVADTSNGDNR